MCAFARVRVSFSFPLGFVFFTVLPVPATPSDLSHSTSLRRIPIFYSFIDSWIKTTGACRYSDGHSFNTFASVNVTSHNACKDFCIEHLNKCDAFDTDGHKCFLFNDKHGKKHTGNGLGADFCYVRDLNATQGSASDSGLYACVDSHRSNLPNAKCTRDHVRVLVTLLHS